MSADDSASIENDQTLPLDTEETHDPVAPASESEESVEWVLPAEPIESMTTEIVNATDVELSVEHANPASAPPAFQPRPDGAVLEAVRTLTERFDRKFADLQSVFEREVRAESSREKVIDRLHAELQDYKQDLLLNTLRPVFIDLIQLHDDIGKVAAAQPETSEETTRIVGLMRGFQEGIEDILYRQGVEPYQNEGEQFDARRQRAVATVPTEDSALVKTIATRHRKGFQSGERVIRPEIVSVHALKKS